jgi:hypothetical protein
MADDDPGLDFFLVVFGECIRRALLLALTTNLSRSRSGLKTFAMHSATFCRWIEPSPNS